MFSSQRGGKKPPKNLGIPKDQYLTVTKLNDVYQSYDFSLTSATQSKARAAAQYRKESFNSAIRKGFNSSLEDITAAQKMDLLMEEKEFLKVAGEIFTSMTSLQRELTDIIIQEEMKKMEVEVSSLQGYDSKLENSMNSLSK